MQPLFNNSDSEDDLKIDNDYAKNYDTWRKKEELNKLKTKYGDVQLSEDSSSSSEDDEVGIQLTEETEKEFYKTLALLKKKDPKIYDNNVVFFNESIPDNKQSQKKRHKEEFMYLKDYERKLLIERGGIVSDGENDDTIKEQESNLTYTEELNKIRESLKKATKEDDEDDSEMGGILNLRKDTTDQEENYEPGYKAWLAGQEKKLKDKETVNSLKPLKEYWSNPNLEDGEKFLKDYILNKRYLGQRDENYIPTYDEIVHDSDENLSEDESAIEKQEEFEHKYNFRFEEPDQEFIKRYPRTLQGTLRKEDTKRKEKRIETKERKAKEKAEKMEELRKLRDLKRKEIEEKIEKLKEITGNDEMGFNDEDIDGDFDPEAHDKRMQALFNDDYYEGPEEEQKPKFNLGDEDEFELETENFDNWTGKEIISEYEPHCEDDDFIMDADYDPKAATQKELIENTKKRKKRRRKSKFVEVLSKDRPNFDPTDKTYEEYIDEYYKLDCEDIIDNIPCRFKYRKVPPNSFGLTVEEILLAKDRELNKWCSLKKAVQIRPEHIEKYDQIAFSKKGENTALKRRILPSLFVSEEGNEQSENNVAKNKGSKKKETSEVKTETHESYKIDGEDKKVENNGGNQNEESNSKKKKKKKAGQQVNDPAEDPTEGIRDNSTKMEEVLRNIEVKPKSTNNKKSIPVTQNDNLVTGDISHTQTKKKKRKKKKKSLPESDKKEEKPKGKKRKHSEPGEQRNAKKSKKNKIKNKDKIDIQLSDARLAAYGLNPKKFKNKIIYGKKK